MSFEQKITEATELRCLRYLLFKTHFCITDVSLFAEPQDKGLPAAGDRPERASRPLFAGRKRARKSRRAFFHSSSAPRLSVIGERKYHKSVTLWPSEVRRASEPVECGVSRFRRARRPVLQGVFPLGQSVTQIQVSRGVRLTTDGPLSVSPALGAVGLTNDWIE